MVLNLSNHPAEAWDPAQRAAAEALDGPVRDIPFPAVPQEADLAALVQRLQARSVTLADGSRVQQFRYVRFRPYPRLT